MEKYSYPLFLAHATDKEINTLNEAKGIKSEIVNEVFEELVKQGLISNETYQKSIIK